MLERFLNELSEDGTGLRRPKLREKILSNNVAGRNFPERGFTVEPESNEQKKDRARSRRLKVLKE